MSFESVIKTVLGYLKIPLQQCCFFSELHQVYLLKQTLLLVTVQYPG